MSNLRSRDLDMINRQPSPDVKLNVVLVGIARILNPSDRPVHKEAIVKKKKKVLKSTTINFFYKTQLNNGEAFITWEKRCFNQIKYSR